MPAVIAHELAQAGFKAQITQAGVLVSLNRRMAKMEVKTALAQIFDEIQFSVEQVSANSCLVK